MSNEALERWPRWMGRIGQIVNDYIATLLHKRPSTGEPMAELDGLRGFAVFLVLASHTNLWGLRGSGAVGVWLFFVLSSFLLTKIMLAKLPASLGARELAKYVIRRIARIIPVYYFCLILVAWEGGKTGEWFLRHCLFMAADAHFWSIPQEEVFYLLLPVLVATVYGLNRWLRLPIPIAAGILMIAIMTRPPFFALPGNFSQISFFLHIFIIGFFLAHLWSWEMLKKLRESRWFLPLANPLSIVCILILFSGGSKAHMEFYNKFIAVPVVYQGWAHPTAFAIISAILLTITITPGSWAQQIFASKGLRLIGILSFSLYLVHHRILTILNVKYAQEEGYMLFIETFILSLILALIFERFIERPSMYFGRQVNARFGPMPATPSIQLQAVRPKVD